MIVYSMWSFSFGILTKKVIQANDPNSHVVKVLSRDQRSKLSMVINVITLASVFIYPMIGMIGRFLVSGLWILSYRKADYYYNKWIKRDLSM
ncbi:hypothetical protein NRIC_20250 [Enterococcus florum]|uniref:Uncharacterized protein n=1 Tax=Enterococcus florum TaxID=2480627 RepID=A0A4P5PCB9_9ENTE|nr:hypothetical protein NRIC_20250 [Enterococcus florum]